MRSAPFQLPLNAGEASRLAALIFQQAEGRNLDAGVRSRLNTRSQGLGLSSMTPLMGSLQRDPIHPSTYYLVIDTPGVQRQSLLLRIALASSPSSGLFPNAILIGRMRTPEGREIVVNAVQFAPIDAAAIRTYAEQVDRAFLPRPQGAARSIALRHEHPEITLPAAFEAYAQILRLSGTNVAAVSVVNQAAVEATLWAAIRSGWREGYTIETEVPSPPPLQGCTKFIVQAGDSIEEIEAVYDAIRIQAGKKFDFEIAFTRDRRTLEEVARVLERLRSGGRSVQVVCLDVNAPEQLASLAELARQLGAIPGIQSSELLPAGALQAIGRATAGRVSYRILKPMQNIGQTLLLAAEHLRG